ncbi:10249_t:CDS:1, partial [Racocetra persica]
TSGAIAAAISTHGSIGTPAALAFATPVAKTPNPIIPTFIQKNLFFSVNFI